MNFWHQIPRPIIGLSPMDGITDAPFRYITARHGGPDVTLTEFVNIQSALYAPRTLIKDFTYSELERPVAAQIYGKTPELFYQVAQVVCELGFDGLDINMGCPAKNVAASGCGAALIRRPDLAREILRAAKAGIADWQRGQSLAAGGLSAELIEQIEAARERAGRAAPARRAVPLSVKTRLGYDRVIVEEWLDVLLPEGLAAVSLHGRTLEQGYKGAADWQAIARAVKLARGSGVLILGNGDVKDLRDARRRIVASGVDGVLIGRAAQGAPWLFRKKDAIKAAHFDEPFFTEPAVSLEERFAIVAEHSERFEQFNGLSRFMAMRKHLTWYCRDFRGAAEMRGRMTRASSADEVRQMLAAFLAGGQNTETLPRPFRAGLRAPSSLAPLPACG